MKFWPNTLLYHFSVSLPRHRLRKSNCESERSVRDSSPSLRVPTGDGRRLAALIHRLLAWAAAAATPPDRAQAPATPPPPPDPCPAHGPRRAKPPTPARSSGRAWPSVRPLPLVFSAWPGRLEAEHEEIKYSISYVRSYYLCKFELIYVWKLLVCSCVRR